MSSGNGHHPSMNSSKKTIAQWAEEKLKQERRGMQGLNSPV